MLYTFAHPLRPDRLRLRITVYSLTPNVSVSQYTAHECVCILKSAIKEFTQNIRWTHTHIEKG